MDERDMILDFVVGIDVLRVGLSFGLESVLDHDLVQLIALHLGNIEGLGDITLLVVKGHHGRFARDFLELGLGVELLEVFEEELLDFGKPVQSSPGARFHATSHTPIGGGLTHGC